MSKETALDKYKDAIKVGPDGHVLLIDLMGDEQAVVDAARISYGKGTKRASEDRHLLRYLMRHQHWTPFEMCELKIRIRIPMDAWRQMIRHRTASVNEYSTRYSEAIDSVAITDPEEWRLQARDNKQGSAGYLNTWPDNALDILTPIVDKGMVSQGMEKGFTAGEYLSMREKDLHLHVEEVYKERLAFGIAKEQARKDLSLSTYTEAYWKCDLRNVLNFLKLRLDPHAQLEIRQFAEAIFEIVQEWVPNIAYAFEEYHLDAVTLTSPEIGAIQMLLSDRDAAFKYLVDSKWITLNEELAIINKSREMLEFESKLSLLGIAVDWPLGPVKKG